MNTGDFVEKAMFAIIDHFDHVDDVSQQVTLEDFNVVWAGRILNNNDAILTARDMLIRALYDGERDVMTIFCHKGMESFTVEGVHPAP